MKARDDTHGTEIISYRVQKPIMQERTSDFRVGEVCRFRDHVCRSFHGAYFWFSFLCLISRQSQVLCWHLTSNNSFHCWSLDANDSNPIPYATCPGINIQWTASPPHGVKQFIAFTVSYELSFRENFWTWAVRNDSLLGKPNFFARANVVGITDATQAKLWCLNTACPTNLLLASQDNCCIHYASVYTCKLGSATSQFQGLCGPWISKTGQFVTETAVMAGSGNQVSWTSVVQNGLSQTGIHSVIAHFEVAGLYVALEAKTTVLPPFECGDGTCESSAGEDCSLCSPDCGTCALAGWKIALIVITCLLAITAAAFLFGFYTRREFHKLWDESWIVPYEVIRQGESLTNAVGATSSQVSQAGMTKKTSQLDRKRFTQTSLYDGQIVAVKLINKKDFLLTKALRAEVKCVRELNHPNLARFIGACVDSPQVAILTEYCTRGSLNDLLLDVDIPVDWVAKFSFALDVCQGMLCLHKQKMIHGHLRSSNCLVDSRWMCKVADYGLKSLRKSDVEKEISSELSRMEFVYTAPELVDVPLAEPTTQTDVFAYAVILVEIANRAGPLGDLKRRPISGLSRKRKLPFDNMEDQYDECPCPMEYDNLVLGCCSQDPTARMSFRQIQRTLKSVNPSKRTQVDTKLSMMEKFSDHLEAAVKEHSVSLELEWHKTDKLLYSMIPRKVADELRQGHNVTAELFEESTVYFSNLVGFGTLTKLSNPDDVVVFLNKMYTCCDAIIDNYDVYKVETIVDAYMVVSGVPTTNGDDHVKEIANMAIDILRACTKFVVPQMKDELLIKIGIHTGPVCAGVVGLKIPHYCLFGETVNIASFLESHGESGRIHMSDRTYHCLQKFKGFFCDPHRVLTFKQQGTGEVVEIMTWWLSGRDDIALNLTHSVTTHQTTTEAFPGF